MSRVYFLLFLGFSANNVGSILKIIPYFLYFVHIVLCFNLRNFEACFWLPSNWSRARIRISLSKFPIKSFIPLLFLVKYLYNDSIISLRDPWVWESAYWMLAFFLDRFVDLIILVALFINSSWPGPVLDKRFFPFCFLIFSCLTPH